MNIHDAAQIPSVLFSQTIPVYWTEGGIFMGMGQGEGEDPLPYVRTVSGKPFLGAQTFRATGAIHFGNGHDFHVNPHAPAIGASAAMKIEIEIHVRSIFIGTPVWPYGLRASLVQIDECDIDIPDPDFFSVIPFPVDRGDNRHGGGGRGGGDPLPL